MLSICGKIMNVGTVVKNTTQRSTCFVTGDFDLGGSNMMRLRLGIMDIYPQELPPRVTEGWAILGVDFRTTMYFQILARQCRPKKLEFKQG